MIYLTAKTADADLSITKDLVVTLPKPLGAGKSITIEIGEIYYGGMRAFPTEIKQMDSQLVIVEHNLYYSSPYATKVQNTKLNIGTKKTESFPKQGKQEGNNIKAWLIKFSSDFSKSYKMALYLLIFNRTRVLKLIQN